MQDKIKVSKFLSYVLRHKPEEIDLKLDDQGWASVDELIEKSMKKNIVLNIHFLTEIVETDDKKRYSFNDDKTKIRASQGHSLNNVNLALDPKTPPDVLYHGTATRFLDSILKEGLLKRNRQYVHLSKDEQTATKVGARHGKPVILKIDSKKMQENKLSFFLSDNDIWLTDNVPKEYITVL